MFVGHAAAAFALVAGGATGRGWPARRALVAGALAAAFATLPDVDMAYALVGLVGAGVGVGAGTLGGDALTLASAFWSTGNVVHRAVTHSLILVPAVATMAALWTGGRTTRRLSAAVALFVVVVAGAASGALGALVTVLFVLGAVAVAEVAATAAAVDARTVFGAALVGLGSHPFGDLFTGEPPAMLYPLDTALVTDRVVLAADPTLHLLGAFGVELGTVWAAVVVVALATGLRPAAAVGPRATLGAGYAASVLLVPAPTLDLSYPFVLSVLGVGLLGVLPRIRIVDGGDGPVVRLPDWIAAALTGLSAVTVAWAAYAVAYVVVG
jgi:hypothetical protein